MVKKTFPSGLPEEGKSRGASGVKQKTGTGPRTVPHTKVSWNSHPILRLAKCILHDAALKLVGHHATDWDVLFAESFSKVGITGAALLEALERRLPQALQVYKEANGGEPLTAAVCLNRVDKQFRQENRPVISSEHPYHSRHLRPVVFWMKECLTKTGGADSTFHQTVGADVPAPEVVPPVTRMKQTDVRGYKANRTQLAAAEGPPKDWGLSQSEIIATLRRRMCTHSVYTLDQLIHDVQALTPALLDSWNAAQRTRKEEEQTEEQETHTRVD